MNGRPEPACPHCRQYANDVRRLRRVIRDRDKEILRRKQQWQDHFDAMNAQLARLLDSQAALKRELDARNII